MNSQNGLPSSPFDRLRVTALRGYHQIMPTKYWSQKVMERSDALDLEQGVFKKSDPKAIARSLKRSAEQSNRRKAEPFRSAMSMLTFYINRGGKNLTKKELQTLEKAKDELRIVFGREPKNKRSVSSSRTRKGASARSSPRPRAKSRAAKRSRQSTRSR